MICEEKKTPGKEPRISAAGSLSQLEKKQKKIITKGGGGKNNNMHPLNIA